MQIAPTASPAKAAPLLPGMAPGHADDASFASLLSQRSEAPQPPAKAPTARTEAEHAAARRVEAERLARQKAEAPADKPPEAVKAAGDPVPDSAASEKPHEDTAAPAAEREAPTLDPALLEWLAALNRPAATPAAPATSAVAADGMAPDIGTATAEDTRGPARLLWRDAPGLAGAAAGARAGHPAQDAQAADAAATGLDVLALAREAAGAATAATDETPLAAWQLDALAKPSTTEPPRAHDGLAALGATAAPASAERSAAPLAVTLRTPATAPEFREALAAQVSVLARDGVQEARLHLNPADMGPISVQIALHGTQAQVNFGADSAATRELIAAGLPELAAALSQAGLTLAGGGVSQHARGGSNDGGAPGGSTGSRALALGDESPDPVAAAQQTRSSLRAALGGVDLFA